MQNVKFIAQDAINQVTFGSISPRSLDSSDQKYLKKGMIYHKNESGQAYFGISNNSSV